MDSAADPERRSPETNWDLGLPSPGEERLRDYARQLGGTIRLSAVGNGWRVEMDDAGVISYPCGRIGFAFTAQGSTPEWAMLTLCQQLDAFVARVRNGGS